MKRRQMTPEQRQRHNAYQRRYRSENKERVRQWRDAYTLRRAAKLLAAEQAAGDSDAGH